MSELENKNDKGNVDIDNANDINNDLDEEIKSKIIINKKDKKNINIFYDFYDFINKLFNFLNQNLFENCLDEVALTFVDYGLTKRDKTITLGRFNSKGWNYKGKDIPSIMITNEWLLSETRNYYELIATIIHEMVHFECQLKSLNDIKNTNYHTVVFKNVGMIRGLIFDEMPDNKYGFSNCKLSDNTKKIIDEFIKKNNFFFNTPFHKNTIQKNNSKKSLKKYFKFTCPNCNTNIQSGLKAKTICGECKEPFLFNDRRYVESKLDTLEEAKEILDYIESELEEFN